MSCFMRGLTKSTRCSASATSMAVGISETMRFKNATRSLVTPMALSSKREYCNTVSLAKCRSLSPPLPSVLR